mgnify:CR=1 FL=1
MTASPLGAITAIAHVTTKQDLSAWTRAHADAPGIKWSVIAGPGGTMVIIEHANDRAGRAARSLGAVTDSAPAAA